MHVPNTGESEMETVIAKRRIVNKQDLVVPPRNGAVYHLGKWRSGGGQQLRELRKGHTPRKAAPTREAKTDTKKKRGLGRVHGGEGGCGAITRRRDVRLSGEKDGSEYGYGGVVLDGLPRSGSAGLEPLFLSGGEGDACGGVGTTIKRRRPKREEEAGSNLDERSEHEAGAAPDPDDEPKEVDAPTWVPAGKGWRRVESVQHGDQIEDEEDEEDQNFDGEGGEDAVGRNDDDRGEEEDAAEAAKKDNAQSNWRKAFEKYQE